MEAGRSSYFCGIVLGFALGIAAAHLMFSPRENVPLRSTSTELHPDVDSDSHLLVTVPPADDVTAHPSSEHRAVFALADMPVAETPAESAPPNQLPTLTSASPLSARAAQEDGLLREMIRQELDTFAASDREVWYETLRDLPPSEATSILQIWKAMRPEKAAAQAITAAPAATVPALPQEAPRPAAATPAPAIPGKPPLAGAVVFHEHNLINANTPGFKRWEPVIVEGPCAAGQHHDLATARPRVIAMRIDMARGELQQTGRPFDLAIDGDGFFTLKLDDAACFTRCGRFSLNDSRQLVIETSDHRQAILEPAIIVPENCAKLMVRDDGTVFGGFHGDDEATPLGTLQLSMFLDPTALRPIGSGLYQNTDDSGPAWQSTPRLLESTIRQGHCERSNVVPEQELAAIDRLKSGRIQSAMPHANTAAQSREQRTAEANSAPVTH